MVTTIPAKIDTLQIIRSLYNDKSLTIFRRVVDGVELEKLDEEMTRKQFYSRLSNLKKSHLITRKEVKIKKGHGQYEPTSLGLVVHRALQLIDKGTSLGWALNAYDAVIHQQKDVSVEDKRRVLDSLVADHEIRSLVGKNHHPTLDEVISKYYQNQQRQQQRQQQEQEQQ